MTSSITSRRTSPPPILLWAKAASLQPSSTIRSASRYYQDGVCYLASTYEDDEFDEDDWDGKDEKYNGFLNLLGVVVGDAIF